MITRMDREIGRIMALLKELGIDKNTLVIFSSDNGPTFNGGTDSDFFESAGEAMVAGDQKYPDQLFSIQLVTDKVVDLGYFSHVKLRGSV